MRKPNKTQRIKLLPSELIEALKSLSDDHLLAAHDYLHEEMERRHGTNKRQLFERRRVENADDFSRET